MYLLVEKHYQKAVDLYTDALDINPSSSVLLSNRAFAHIRLEEYGSAIADATKALDCDPSYAKAYYRRGDASFALSRFRDAVKDFRAAAKLAPRDPDLRRKVASVSCTSLVNRVCCSKPKSTLRDIIEVFALADHDGLNHFSGSSQQPFFPACLLIAQPKRSHAPPPTVV